MPKFLPMRETASRYYADKIRAFGATARGVDWNSEDSQLLRFRQLLRLADRPEAGSIIDFGCGYGAFANYLHSAGWQCRYTGYDICDPMIAQARAAHGGDARCTFTSDADALAVADYTFASGIFNVKQDHPAEAWQEYVLATIETIGRLSARGFAFNMLSTYSDRDKRRGDLFYGAPAFFFDYCQTRFPSGAVLLHDYPLHEFTVFVRK